MDAVLPNIRHELYAQERARGSQIQVAARRAGYQHGGSGYDLEARPDIKSRINYILECGAEDAKIDAAKVIRALDAILTTDIRDVIDMVLPTQTHDPFTGAPIDPQRILLLHPREWPNAVAMAVHSLEFTKDGSPKIKMHDKLKAVELAGRALGMWKDNLTLTAPTGPVPQISAEMPPEDAAKAYQLMLGKS